MNEPHLSAKGSTTKGKIPAAKGPKLKPIPLSGKRKRGLFDLEPTPDREPFGEEESFANGTNQGDYGDEGLNYGGMDDSLDLPNGGGPSQVVDSQEAQHQDSISPSIERNNMAAAAKVKGKRGKTAVSKLTQAETKDNAPGSGRRGRPKKQKISASAVEPIEEPAEAPAEELAEKLAAERAEEPAEASAEEASEESMELKKRSGCPQKAGMQPPKTRPARGRAALNAKDPNTMLKPPRTRRGSSTAAKGSMSPSKTRFIRRSETPGDELHFHTTRAGRNVVKPLAFWRGEAALFSPGRIDEGQRLLPTIKEVIRTEEVVEPRPKKTFGQSRKRRARPERREEDDELPEEDEDDQGEYWETEAGVMQASVMLWDPETGRGDEENVETAGKCWTPTGDRWGYHTHPSADVAYAGHAIQMRDISGADFQFAKTLTLPFFGSGMVDLPPGGTKRLKNSRKMQMVFFVFYGRVLVELGTPTQRFSIGRGGMWQVPRGEPLLPLTHFL